MQRQPDQERDEYADRKEPDQRAHARRAEERRQRERAGGKHGGGPRHAQIMPRATPRNRRAATRKPAVLPPDGGEPSILHQPRLGPIEADGLEAGRSRRLAPARAAP